MKTRPPLFEVLAAEPAWRESCCTLGAAELARTCRLIVADLAELVEDGFLTPAARSAGSRQFSTVCVEPLRKAAALRAHFDLDLFVVGHMYWQFEQTGKLEQQVQVAPGHAQHEGPGRWREPHN